MDPKESVIMVVQYLNNDSDKSLCDWAIGLGDIQVGWMLGQFHIAQVRFTRLLSAKL